MRCCPSNRINIAKSRICDMNLNRIAIPLGFIQVAAGSASVHHTGVDPASAFQHHVSMWYNNGKMNHWLEAHIHTLNPLLTPFGSRRACKVLKSESGLRGDWSYWPQKWGLHRQSNKYRLLRHWKQTCCRFSILSQVVLFVFPPLLEPAGMPRSVFTSFRQFQWGSGSHLTGFYATLLA